MKTLPPPFCDCGYSAVKGICTGCGLPKKMKTLPPPPFSVRVENNEEWNKIAPMLEADGYTWWSSGELPTKEEPMEYPDYIDCFGNKEIAAEGLDVPEFDIFDPNPFHLTHPSDLIPAYQTSGSAGFDIAANLPEKPLTIDPQECMAIPTGILYENMPKDLALWITPRSGLALKYKITVLNTPGLCDSDFPNEVMVILMNHGKEPFVVRHGDRIAQGVFVKVERPSSIVVKSNERIGGFGSTNEQTGPIVEGVSGANT